MPILRFGFSLSVLSTIFSVSEIPKVLPTKIKKLPNKEEDKRPIVAIARPKSKPSENPSLLKLSPIIVAAPCPPSKPTSIKHPIKGFVSIEGDNKYLTTNPPTRN